MPITIIKKPKHSNKTQTLSENPPVSLDGSNASQSPVPFIDKISLVFTPPNNDIAHDLYRSVFASLDDSDLFAPTSGGMKGGYKIAKRIALPSIVDFKKLPLFQLRYDKLTKIAEKMRLEFVPQDLGQLGMIELHAAMVSLVDDGWASIAKHALVTRIDVAVDLHGVRMDGFLFLPKQTATTMRWTMNGVVESVVIGKNKGNQTLIYDRKAKRLAKDPKWKGGKGVRIERRLVGLKGLKLSALIGLKNPFANMVLTQNIPGPPRSGKEWEWSMFCDSVKVRGLTDALKLLPAERRTKYRKHLSAHSQPWWNPAEIWTAWPNMIKELKISSTDW